MSGVLEHSVEVLKLCLSLTDPLARVPLDRVGPQLNELICEGTARIVPLFDDVLRTLAARTVDVRLIEARVTSLTTAAWALLAPFYMLDAKYKHEFGPIMRQMQAHQQFLQLAVQRAQEGLSSAGSPTATTSTGQALAAVSAAAGLSSTGTPGAPFLASTSSAAVEDELVQEDTEDEHEDSAAGASTAASGSRSKVSPAHNNHAQSSAATSAAATSSTGSADSAAASGTAPAAQNGPQARISGSNTNSKNQQPNNNMVSTPAGTGTNRLNHVNHQTRPQDSTALPGGREAEETELLLGRPHPLDSNLQQQRLGNGTKAALVAQQQQPVDEVSPS